MVVRQAPSNYLKKGELASSIHISMVVYAALKLCYSIVNRRGKALPSNDAAAFFLTWHQASQSSFFLWDSDSSFFLIEPTCRWVGYRLANEIGINTATSPHKHQYTSNKA